MTVGGAVLAAGLLAACAGVDDRIRSAEAIAARAGFSRQAVRADRFTLVAFERIRERGGELTVYIEGDGKAWSSRTMLSTNPTPEKPVALELAVRDPSPNVVYLARPCQYIETGQDARCTEDYWSSRRFAPEVIAATGQAIDHFKRRAGAGAIHLVGFSGGAAVAALAAAKRSDVATLRTVAGNLDHVALHTHHKVSQLRGSLNALDVAPALARLPQVHFSGGRDEIVPAFIARRYADAAGDSPCIRLVPVPGAGHETGWAEAWPGLVRMVPSCSGSGTPGTPPRR